MGKVILDKVKDQNNTFLDKIYLTYLSFLGTGYSPFAPGTIGSLATIPLIFIFHLLNLNVYFFVLILMITTFLTCLITEKIQRKYSIHDPGWIVIDEVLGMLVTWLFIYPTFDFKNITLVFIFFRFFDIIKIWPASFFDKKVTHGSGTILDDIVSGIYAGLVILINQKFLGIF